MGRALIERATNATTYTMPRSVGIVISAIVAIIVAAGISAFVARADGEVTIWTWLLPAIVATGLAPIILNAAIPQRVRIDLERLDAKRWFGRQTLSWSSVEEVVSYSNAQELFLRARSGRSRIMLTTRWLGWDADDLRSMARDIDTVLDERGGNVRRPGPLDRFPSMFSKDAGLAPR